MKDRNDLVDPVVQALKAAGGSATLLDVCKAVWLTHENAIRQSDLFYTWQYEVRHAAAILRKSRIMKPAQVSPRGVWELA